MEQLKAHHIPFESESSSPSFDPLVPNYSGTLEFRIKLLPEDFARVNKLLENHYKEQLDSVDSSYYLFYFSDEELMEIISKFDEWGHMDQVLAQKILKERNKEIPSEIVTLLKKSRLNELEKPEAAPRYLLYLGYFASALFGLIGFFIGCHLSYFKKPLPNGKQMYVYREQDRNHGTRMLLIGTATLVLFVFLSWIYDK
jgi:hypothetical protein